MHESITAPIMSDTIQVGDRVGWAGHRGTVTKLYPTMAAVRLVGGRWSYPDLDKLTKLDAPAQAEQEPS